MSELRRSAKGRWLLAGLAFAGLLLFTALGIWQGAFAVGGEILR